MSRSLLATRVKTSKQRNTMFRSTQGSLMPRELGTDVWLQGWVRLERGTVGPWCSEDRWAGPRRVLGGRSAEQPVSGQVLLVRLWERVQGREDKCRKRDPSRSYGWGYGRRWREFGAGGGGAGCKGLKGGELTDSRGFSCDVCRQGTGNGAWKVQLWVVKKNWTSKLVFLVYVSEATV